MVLRQPIVSVLGHVDHGKTTILDWIRGTSVARKEAGGITQHIGATEVPLEAIKKLCGPLLRGKEFKVPGLLFIDTPGHEAFRTLRARGGALADLAVLVVDINEGIMPQTVESIEVLKMYRTPFVVAANKIDRIKGWKNSENQSFLIAIKNQKENVVAALEEKIYQLVGSLYNYGFNAERFDRISDFTKTVAIVPTSGKLGIGIQELLLVLVGLAQKFLEERLWHEEEGPGRGTVLEVKEEKGMGTTIDLILYSGHLRKGDEIMIATPEGIKITKVRGIFKPKPLDEMRDPTDRFMPVEEVSAACGVKVVAPDLDGVISGSPVFVVSGDIEKLKEEISRELQPSVETSDEGITIKGDALGSIEALGYQLKKAKIPIRKAEVGDVSKRDVVEAAAQNNPLYRVVLAFNVKVYDDAKEEADRSGVEILTGNIIYKIVEDYQEWVEKKKRELEEASREEIVYPGKIKILPEYIFRVSKPAIVGVRVLAGRIRPGQRLMREDGRVIGVIKSIRTQDQSLKEARMGEEVAIAIEGPTVGRQIKPNDVLYVDIPESHARKLFSTELSFEEREVLEEVARIKRKEKPTWGL